MKNLGRIDFEDMNKGKIAFNILEGLPFGINLANITHVGYFGMPDNNAVTVAVSFHGDIRMPDVIFALESEEEAQDFLKHIEKENLKTKFKVLNFK